MYHRQRWTPEKIKQRLTLIAPLVYAKRKSLPSFRYFERKRGQVKIQMGWAVESAWETNLLEENESELSVDNDSIHLNLSPYQIMTLRIKEKA